MSTAAEALSSRRWGCRRRRGVGKRAREGLPVVMVVMVVMVGAPVARAPARASDEGGYYSLRLQPLPLNDSDSDSAAEDAETGTASSPSGKKKKPKLVQRLKKKLHVGHSRVHS
ncbi:hypothetical protein DFH08DRAFT_956962 [Mycena albidolilacea]|uniref:Uncharacterized protein n=1 Tax=Mycena albidolilacea TaxID=1033008 RepID=A0AAD7A8H6_9AGAR|nr:hypothetical protein DFH08DRAFT_956962 [Mycena albidolilacea]